MTTGKDQTETVIFDVFVFLFRQITGGALDLFGEFVQKRIMPSSPSHPIDRLEAAGGNQPGAGIRWYPLTWPLFHRSGEGFMERLFSHIEIAQQTDQRRQDLA